jgi:hypothetical protein
MDRKKFIQLSFGLVGTAGLISSCTESKVIRGEIIGASAGVGHLLRDKKFQSPAETVKKKVVIIGGGVSGLSAARYLHKNGLTDFMVLDLEKRTGGNAAFGQNELSAYPWGAHYIPIPNPGLLEYINFLKECNVITGEDANGLPVYNELYLCFDPQERLYINGRWQDGLIPQFGIQDKDQLQFSLFLHQMETYRKLKGEDGKDAFAIPVDESSKDSLFTVLDSITMKAWMEDKGFTSDYLHRYINYCCRDDFGTPHHLVSAWAGIHYFASRKGKGVNVEHGDVLTWPEGNGFLVKHLQKEFLSEISTDSLVVNISSIAGGIKTEYLDVKENRLIAVESEYCIMAIPQFIAGRILNDTQRSEKIKKHLHYAPWMVANLLVDKLEERSGAPLSWDNVLHESNSLGYVDATHEILHQTGTKRNLTYYLPLTGKSPQEERKAAQMKTHADWVKLIIDDLQKVHPNINSALEEVNIMLWGHAMVQPLPGLIHGEIRKSLAQPIGNRIFFAHTDLAGISIFEEAFYQGLSAAKKIIGQIK